MKKYKRLFNEKFYKLSKKECDLISSIIKDNSNIAFSFFKKIYQYTNNWKHVNFNNDELNFYNKIYLKKLKLPFIIYRCEDNKSKNIVRNYKDNKVDFKPKDQYTSWTTNFRSMDYFMRGYMWPVKLKSNLTIKDKFIDITFLFSYKNEISTYIDELKFPINLENLFEDMTMYDESEILLFGNKIAYII